MESTRSRAFLFEGKEKAVIFRNYHHIRWSDPPDRSSRGNQPISRRVRGRSRGPESRLGLGAPCSFVSRSFPRASRFRPRRLRSVQRMY